MTKTVPNIAKHVTPAGRQHAKPLLLLSSKKTESRDFNFVQIASFLGAEVVRMERSTFEAAIDGHATPLQAYAAVVVHAETLADLYDEKESGSAPVRNDLLAAESLFVYGFSQRIDGEILRWLSGGAVVALDTVKGTEYGELPLAGKRLTLQLAGAQYPRTGAGLETDVFVTGKGTSGLLPLITVAQRPTLLCLQLGRCSVLMSTASCFPHGMQQVTAEEDIEAFYDVLLPLLVFVRTACKEFGWHGGWTGARLIIDDPVLRYRYGFLDFRELFQSLDRHSYAATVAYIPWNQLRTTRQHASFFNAAGERFSICVHGCDHANNEYGSPDEAYLVHKSRLAIARMRRHQARTGMGFEPVMVFPQGRFSSAGLRALRSSNFLAAINTTRLPVDQEASPVYLYELLLPAIVRPLGVPVFVRHYPRSVFPYLLDLFLGRPAFVVEHHDFFRDGFSALESLVDCLNDCEPGLRWESLSETLQQACWKRALSADRWEIRFFTDKFKLANTSNESISYRLWKEEPERETNGFLSVGQRTTEMIRWDGRVGIETTLAPGEVAHVELQPAKRYSRTSVSVGGVYRGKVLVRRALSELRDEFLMKRPAMLRPAKGLVKLLKVGASSRESDRPSAAK